MLKILFIGDIFGKVGRDTVDTLLHEIISKDNIDLVIANSENVTHGRGMSLQHYNKLMESGIDIFTGGNHTFDNQDVYEYIDNQNFIRPANYNRFVAGKGTEVFSYKGINIRVTNILGRAFINANTNNFYEVMDDILEQDNSDIHIIDFHGEATAEKIAFFATYNGMVDAILGTHTHVQTADEQIKNNTAYISDVGATCALDSVIGANKKEVLFKEKVGLPIRFRSASGEGQFCAVKLTFDNENKIENIERVYIKNI
ncbi:TIGR00282 family metallophosphoesterase [Spiroplasma endosymbiont of Crioceris asparagi]|uniref:TIGR00282 family metallophosphoesterase n=1 Tax=Spiroplasma endosymbiont of Crioceris asparagi TaxID=3066286 RepID=UPI0030CD34A2